MAEERTKAPPASKVPPVRRVFYNGANGGLRLGFEDRFKLRLPLGERDYGTIWSGEDQGGQAVAIAVLEDDVPDEFRERFVRDAGRLVEVSHPNLVRVVDAGTTGDGSPYMAMEMLEGETLSQRLADGKPLEVGEVVELGSGLLEGLAAAHAAGVVHGDLEPGNIFLVDGTGDVTPKLISWGLNRGYARSSGLPGDDSGLLPSLAFMAPEQARGELGDERTDLYGLAAVMQRAFMRGRIYDGDTVEQIARAVTNASDVDASIGEALGKVIAKAMETESAARYANAAEMRGALLAAFGAQDSQDAAGIDAAAKPSPPKAPPKASAPRPPPKVTVPKPGVPKPVAPPLVPPKPAAKAKQAFRPPSPSKVHRLRKSQQSRSRPRGAPVVPPKGALGAAGGPVASAVKKPAPPPPASAPAAAAAGLAPVAPKKPPSIPPKGVWADPGEEETAVVPPEESESAGLDAELDALALELEADTVEVPDPAAASAVAADVVPPPEPPPALDLEADTQEVDPTAVPHDPVGEMDDSTVQVDPDLMLARASGDSDAPAAPGSTPPPPGDSAAPGRVMTPRKRTNTARGYQLTPEPPQPSGALEPAAVGSSMDAIADSPELADRPPGMVATPIAPEEEPDPTQPLAAAPSPDGFDEPAPFDDMPLSIPTRGIPRWIWAAIGGFGLFVGMGVALAVFSGGDETESTSAEAAPQEAQEGPEHAAANPPEESGPEPGPSAAESGEGSEDAAEQAEAEPAEVEAAEPEEAAPAGDVITVALDGVPDGATVEVDGRRVEGTNIEVRRDRREHRVKVQADGFRTFRSTFDADQDQSIAVRLIPRRGSSTMRPRMTMRPSSTSMPAMAMASMMSGGLMGTELITDSPY